MSMDADGTGIASHSDTDGGTEPRLYLADLIAQFRCRPVEGLRRPRMCRGGADPRPAGRGSHPAQR